MLLLLSCPVAFPHVSSLCVEHMFLLKVDVVFSAICSNPTPCRIGQPCVVIVGGYHSFISKNKTSPPVVIGGDVLCG